MTAKELNLMIRKATPLDAPDLLDMLIQLDSETPFMMYEPGERTATADAMSERLQRLSEGGSVMFVALDDAGKPVGFLSAERGVPARIRHTAYIVTGILSSHQGQGIGRRFFQELEVWALENGVCRLELTVMTHNTRALSLYQHAGFEIEGTRRCSMIVHGAWTDEYAMVRLLPPAGV